MTDEVKPRGRKPQIAVTPRTDDVDWDAALAERASNPHGDPIFQLPLRDPERWDTYIASAAVNPARHYDMVHKKKWVPFTVSDLPDGITPESVGFQVAPDGQTLCRGARGEEVVFKQPKVVRNKVQQMKTEANKKGMGSAAKVKQDMATAAGARLGSEAGDFVQSNITISGGDREGPLGA